MSVQLSKGVCKDGGRCLICLSSCVRVCTDGLRCLVCLSSCLRVCSVYGWPKVSDVSVCQCISNGSRITSQSACEINYMILF